VSPLFAAKFEQRERAQLSTTRVYTGEHYKCPCCTELLPVQFALEMAGRHFEGCPGIVRDIRMSHAKFSGAVFRSYIQACAEARDALRVTIHEPTEAGEQVRRVRAWAKLAKKKRNR
jgi:hypothetical protein